jgi:hypothetical protein
MNAKDKNGNGSSEKLSKRALSKKIKRTTEMLEHSTAWASSLIEHISDFPTSAHGVFACMNSLEVQCRTREMSSTQQRKILSLLKKLRCYSKDVSDESRPLTVLNIIEDLNYMDDLLGAIKALLEAI